jgi:hypothetical protein
VKKDSIHNAHPKNSLVTGFQWSDFLPSKIIKPRLILRYLVCLFLFVFPLIGWSQTTIPSGTITNASTIPAGNTITIQAGGSLNMDVARTFASITTTGVGTSSISGTGLLTVTNAVTIGNGNTLSLGPNANAATLNTIAINGYSGVLSGTGTLTLSGQITYGDPGNGNSASLTITNTVITTGLNASFGGGPANSRTITNNVNNGTIVFSGLTYTNTSSRANFLFSYTAGTLQYNATVTATSIEWPLANSPTHVVINGSITLPGSRTIQGNLSIGNSGSFSVGGFDLTVSGATTIGEGSSGTLNITSSTGTKTFTGLVTINNGATWNNSGNSSVTFQGGITNTGTFTAGTGIHNFTTSSQALTGTFSIPNVTVSGITLTNNNNLTVGTSLAGTGTLSQATGATLTLTGTSTVTGLVANASDNTVVYNGASQVVKGTDYFNLIVNQSAGTASLGGSASVANVFTLSNGNLDLGTSNLTIGLSGSISVASPSANRMIIASGGGEVRKEVNATGSFTFPIGDNTGTVEYSPVTVNITSASGFSSAYVGASVINTKHPSNFSATHFLNRYWNITQSGITACVADVTGTYLSADINGTEGSIRAAQLNGTFNQLTNPWEKFSVLGGNTLNANGATLTAGQTSAFTGITGANPTVSITGGNVSICSGDMVQLNSIVTGDPVILYTWSPSTGLSADNIPNPAASPSATTTYTLTITDGNGIIASDNTTITVSPGSTFEANLVSTDPDNTICQGESVTFIATPINASNYEFFVNGLSVQNGASNSYTTTSLNDGDQVFVTVTTTGGCGGSDDSNVITMTVNANPTPGLTSSDADNIICAGESVTFTGSGGVNYEFFVDGTSVQNSASDTYTTTTLQSGQTVTVRVTNAAGCFVTSAGITTTVNPNPVASIVSNDADNIICAGTSVTFTATPAAANYNFRVNTVSVQNSATNTFTTSTLAHGDVVDVIVTSAGGCSGTSTGITMTVNANPTPGLTSSDADNIICAGESMTFTGSGGVNYEFFVDGTSVQNSASDMYTSTTMQNGQTVSVRVTNAAGCSAMSGGITMTVNPNPVASIVSTDADNIICAGASVTFTATPAAANYNFRINSFTVQSGASNTFTTSALAHGDVVDVIVTSAANCSATSPSITMTVNANPTPGLTSSDADNIICAGESVTFTGSGGVNYEFFVDGTSVQNSASDTYTTSTLQNGQTVTVRVTNAAGCFATSAGITTTVNPNPTPVISGINVVCEDQQNVVYSTPMTGNNFSWSVTGGVIDGPATNNSVTVDWGAAGSGTLQVTETIAATGCFSTTPLFSVTINPRPAPVITGPNSVCENESGVIYSTPNVVGDTYTWTVTGGNIMAGAGTNSITVTWGPSGAGSVQLVQSNALGCSTTTPLYAVTIAPSVIVDAGENDEVCQASGIQPYNFATDRAGIATASNSNGVYLWSANPIASGTFSDASLLNPVFDVAAGFSGTITFTVTAEGNGSCPPAQDSFTLIVTPAPLVNAGSNLETCQGSSISFAIQTTLASASNFSSILWTHTGTGTIFNANTLTPTYLPGTGETGTVIFTLTATGNGSCTSVNDQMSLAITPAPLVNAGSDAEICAGNTFNFTSQSTAASASNYNTISWTHTGTGSLANANTLTPTYTPDAGETGTVTFTLTATGNGSCASVNDQMILTITPAPLVNAGSDLETCQGSSISFGTQSTLASASNFSSILWTHTGTGSIFNANTLTPTYQPGTGETGTVTFTLIANGNGSCTSVNDQMSLTITPAPLANAGSDAEICAGSDFNFSTQSTAASASNFNTITWTHTGAGSLANANTLTPTYTPGAGETGTVTFTLTATGNGSCASVNDQMILTITPAPLVNAGSDIETCQGSSISFATQTTLASASNFSSILWTHIGTGTIFNANTLSPTYQPGTGETGTVTFTLTANGNGSCTSVNDQMSLTITPAPLANAGSDAEICAGSVFNFSAQSTAASASNFNTITWTHTGTGTLANANTLTPTYTPGAGETGTVTFTLTATGNGSCASVNDQMILTITPAPLVNAGSDLETCQGSSISFGTQSTLASASNFSSILWTHTGTGTIFNANTLSPTYQPGTGETGTVTFTLTANGNGSCTSVNDQMSLAITPAPLVNAGSDAEICAGSDFNFSAQSTFASASNFNTITWTHTGAGTLANANTLTPTYTPDAGETGTVTFTLTATGNGSCASVNDQMILTITPAPLVNAGSDLETCQGSSISFATQTPLASASNFSSILWTHTGTGTIFNANTLTPTYQPGTGETGTVTFTLIANGNGSCTSVNDQMSLTITPAPLVNAGSDAEICAGNTFNFTSQSTAASASNYNTISWTHTGAGTLANANTLTPAYTPDAGETGTVTFTLTATGNGSCASVNDQMILTITPAPLVNAGSDLETCQGSSISFATQTPLASASNFSSILWTHTGTGTIFNANTLSPTYQPGTGETGTVTFTLTANGNGSCTSVNDQMSLTITPAPLVNAGSDAEICAGSDFNFSAQSTFASASNFNTITWTHTGAGTLANANTLTPTYTPGTGETGTVTFTLTATGNGSCASVMDQMVLIITPTPSANAGSNEEICQGSSFAFTNQTSGASASNYSSVVWSHNGSGTLFNGNTLTPTYLSSPSEAGTLTFTLTAIGLGSCPSINSNMELLITPAPMTNAGSDAEVCEGTSAFEFSARTVTASTSNGASLWTHNGAGSLDDPTALHPVYTVSPADVDLTLTFVLTVTSPSAVCAVVEDSFNLKVNRAATVSVPETSFDVCEPTRIKLGGTIGGSATLGSWSILSGDGTLSISSVTGDSVTATYDLLHTDVRSTLVFRLTTNDPDAAGPCQSEFVDVQVTVDESAKVFAGSPFAICEYDTIKLNGSFGGAATSVTWSGGTSNFDDPTNPVANYILSQAEIDAANLSISFTLTTNDPPGVCPSVSSQVVVTVYDTLGPGSIFFIGLNATYQEDQTEPVILTGVPASGGTGVFSGNGVPSGTNQFIPAFAELGTNVITYTFTPQATGCVSRYSQSTIVNPVTDIDWIIPGATLDGNGFPQICSSIGDVLLRGFPDVDDATAREGTRFSSPDLTVRVFQKLSDQKYYINTKDLAPGVYNIIYTFVNESGSVTNLQKQVTVFATPKSIIDVGNSCVSDDIFFAESSTIPDNLFGASIVDWLWNFGDGNGSSMQEPTYRYLTDNNYSVRLRVTTNEGCQHDTTKLIRVGPVPAMNFTWSEFCNGVDTKFTDNTNAGISTIINYEWNFGDGLSLSGPAGGTIPPAESNGGRTTGTYTNPNHRYDNPDQYNVMLTVETDDGCINSITRRTFIQAYDVPTPTSGYFEDFMDGPGTWVVTKANNSTLLADDIITDTSWEFGPANGSVIQALSPDDPLVWWTRGNPKSDSTKATYYNNEKTAVIGPCLNLTNIKRPMVSIDYWADLEDQRDGAVLQYSINGGVDWYVVGNVSDAGINWYNRSALSSDPGRQITGQIGWTGVQGGGWTAIQNGWKTARFNLDMIPVAERDEVIFRIAFGSDNNNILPDGRFLPYEGFAFDNIFIGEKQRNVLVEHFTNSEWGPAIAANTYLDNLYQQQFSVLEKDSSDFIKIQYHIANPLANLLNQQNPIDPAARSLFYGVSQPPASIMDGILGNYNGTDFTGEYVKVNAIQINRRALEDPLFGIILTQNPTQSDSINVSVRFEFLSTDTLMPVTFHVGLVEGNVNGNINVLRKLLLGTEGVTVNRLWTTGTIQNISVKALVDVPIVNGNDLWLVVFAQDRQSKRIHQSRILKSDVKTPANIVGLEDDPVFAFVKDIVVFPNPASQKINLAIDSRFSQPVIPPGYTWQLVDQRGITVTSGQLNEDLSVPQQIEINTLANGLYILGIRYGDRPVLYKKIAVMNRSN